MKKKRLFMCLLAAVGLLLTGCSPKVVTNIVSELPSQPVDSVRVFLPGELVPQSAVVVGDVAVKDRGTTLKCNYDYVVQLGKEATAQHGGNVLLIQEHRLPSLKSSCHQIFGSMLYADSWNVDTTMIDTLSFLATDDTFGAQMVYTERRNNPANVVKLSAGLSYITSKVYSEYGKVSDKDGMDFIISYEHIGKKSIGFGFSAAFNKTTFGGMGNQEFFYIGPDFVISHVTTKNWRWDMGIGVGYTHYKQAGGLSDGGVGTLCRLGVEYVVSNHFALGIDWNTMSRTFPTPSGIPMEKNERYGFDSMSLTAGLRFYF